MTDFEKYLRKRLLEAYVNISFYGTMDPDEVARKKAEGLNLRGIPKAEGLNPRGIPKAEGLNLRGIPTPPEDEQ